MAQMLQLFLEMLMSAPLDQGSEFHQAGLPPPSMSALDIQGNTLPLALASLPTWCWENTFPDMVFHFFSLLSFAQFFCFCWQARRA